MYIIIEAMADAGVKMGLPRDLSYQLAAQTMVGLFCSDGKWASFLGTGTSGHGVCGHGQARAMPLFQLLGMGTNLRA